MSWINSINRNSEDKNHEEVANYWNEILDNKKKLLFNEHYETRDL
jgi:hypothetical protein